MSCGTWWPNTTKATGKGKGWYRKATDGLLDTPPGLKQLKPLKKAKNQQAAAAELLAITWDVIPEGIQGKLGPPPQEPELTDLLKSHTSA